MATDLLSAAREYVVLGFSIIPVGSEKKPTIPWKEFQNRYATDDELRIWFDPNKEFGISHLCPKIGIVTGKISNLTVVDVDTHDIIDLMEEESITVSTPRGFHYYYTFQEGLHNKAAIIPHVDIRGEGGYVVAPPSEGYCFVGGLNFLPDFPKKILDLVSQDRLSQDPTQVRGGDPGKISPGLGTIQEGQRNSTLTSLAGTMRSRGFTYDAILAALVVSNNERCNPPLPESEVAAIARSVSNYEPGGLTNMARATSGVSDRGYSNVPEEEVELITYNQSKLLTFEEPELIRTGIHCLDTYLNGGLGLKELSLFVGEQETGKSTLACYIGAYTQRQGYNVLHVFYEDQLRNIKSRYDFLLPDTQSETEVYFLDATAKPVKLWQIEEQIKKVNPGLVILDYFARIPAISESKDSRFELKDILTKLANMARTYNCHIMVLDHVLIVNTSLNPSYKMELWRLSEAKMYKSMITDILVGIAKDRTDNHLLYFTGLKAKRFAAQMFERVRVDWTTGEYRGA